MLQLTLPAFLYRIKVSKEFRPNGFKHEAAPGRRGSVGVQKKVSII
jgi:hypothetical protein